eukprot:COSAG02_NODE_40984_length_399_cov_0.863333_1_plen_25_part_01
MAAAPALSVDAVEIALGEPQPEPEP